MALLGSLIFEALRESVGLQIATALVCLLAYPAVQAIYNLYFHPLSKYPGSKLWAISRLPFIYHMIRGNLIRRERELHEKYGGIIRLAPDEISFASEQAWNDIYTSRRGHKRAPRDPIYYFGSFPVYESMIKLTLLALNEKVDNVMTTNDPKFHGRARTLLTNSFTDDALRAQYPLINGHADALVSKIKDLINAQDTVNKGALVNITDWINFFTLDVIGDLAFGEAFACLSTGQYHYWVRTLFSFVKGLALATACQFYPATKTLFEKLIPKSVLEELRQYTQFAHAKINRRLDTKTERPDFITPFMKNNTEFEIMSRDEILSTFTFIIGAGSETLATVLTGIFSHLTKNKEVMARLCSEIRRRFKEEKDITFDAIIGNPYLEAVLNESLRLCNPVPVGLPRIVPEGGDTYDGVYLPEGTKLGVRTFAVNRSRKLFANPDRFVPERWLPIGERPEEYDHDQLSASKPFSVGFHSCLGRNLAWVELRLVVTRLLWAFDILDEPTERVEFDDFPVILLVQKQPMKIRVKVRQEVE